MATTKKVLIAADNDDWRSILVLLIKRLVEAGGEILHEPIMLDELSHFGQQKRSVRLVSGRQITVAQN
jgi:hypothetical protein